MSRLKLVAVALATVMYATISFAADNAPAERASPAEIVIIGGGEMMDALQRAVEEEVAIINKDGGVMGQPLKVTRENGACDPQSPYSVATRAKSMAGRRPILVLQSYCYDSGEKYVAAFADHNILVMGVGDWPDELTEERPGPTVFRLAPNRRLAQEIAFKLSALTSRTLQPIPPTKGMDEIFDEFSKGFAATQSEEGRWGGLLDPAPGSVNQLPKARLVSGHDGSVVEWKYEPETMKQATLFIPAFRSGPVAQSVLTGFANQGWRGTAVFSTITNDTLRNWKLNQLTALPDGIEIHVFQRQPFYLGPAPPGAKAYTAFHPDWVAGFWQVMKAIKYAKSLNGREIAKTLGGPPFFSRAPWLMLQSQSRYTPPELRQRFNDTGDLRMAGYKLEKIWPKDRQPE